MLHIELSEGTGKTLTRQIYDGIKDQILNGVLKSGARLPASRMLAENLNVSRTIIVEVYEQLIAEGYIYTKKGSGTFVAEGVSFVKQPYPEVEKLIPIATGYHPIQKDIIDFRSGLPDLYHFPMHTWKKLTIRTLDRFSVYDLVYSNPEGIDTLRTAISDYLVRYRGINCHPDQLLITAGTTQAIGIISRLLLNDDKRDVVIEDPITRDIQCIIQQYGGRLQPVPVDRHGLITDELPGDVEPAFIYTTPSHQFPLGVTMSAKRRIELLRYASAKQTYIIEDDYDSEFRYDAPPISAMQELSPDKVIYIGTFSKTLFPALRTAYIVFPPKLINRGREIKWFSDLHNTTIGQYVLADFINQGYFLKHVTKLRKILKKKYYLLVQCLNDTFGDGVEIIGRPAGLHLVARFKNRRFDNAFFDESRQRGIKLYPVELHGITKGRYEDCLIIGFGMLTDDRIKEGIAVLKECLLPA